ncbi:MAG: hypothetical protein SX243_08560 [Acidobacteriota bacterium]|nr:hypothetical protein [Acidobacteriota bacterium]
MIPRVKIFLVVSVLSLLLVVGTVAAQGGAARGGADPQGAQQQMNQQQAAQQQAAQQQAAQHMNQRQMERMTQALERVQRLEQRANRMMEQMAGTGKPAAGGQSMGGQAMGGQMAGMGDRDRQMMQLCDSVATLAGDMTRAMDRIHQNLQDPDFARDRDMQRDMDRLREHIEDMTGPLEDALQTMDRMRDRLHKPDAGS